MEKEPHQNEPPNGDENQKGKIPHRTKVTEDLESAIRHEIRECPNCGHDLELVTVPAEFGNPEKEVFHCFYCLEHTEDLWNDDLSEEGDFDEEDDAHGEDSLQP